MAAKRETSVETTRSGLPGYENLTQEAYKTLMYKKLEERRLKLVAEYKAKGHRFPTKHDLRKAVSGTSPRNTKKSSRNSKRPLVLTSCPERRRQFLDWYFGIYNLYKKAVIEYLSGNLAAVFPPGTYRPPGPFVSP